MSEFSREKTYRYHPKDKQVPEGWEIANNFAGLHHGIYSVLIRQKEDHRIPVGGVTA